MASSGMTIVSVSNLPAIFALMMGTSFESLPPRVIVYRPFQFLTQVELRSVGLGLESVPFHSGWTLVEWNPTLTGVWVDIFEVMNIYADGGWENLMEEGNEPSMEGLTGDEAKTGAEPISEFERTGSLPVREEEMEDSYSENLPSTSEGPQEAVPQTPAAPVLESLFSGVPRRSRYKTVARRTRTSRRIAAHVFRSRAVREGPPVIEEIKSSSEESPTEPSQTPSVPQGSPVRESQQTPSEHRTPSSRPAPKRKAGPSSPSPSQTQQPSAKRAKSVMAPSPLLEKFLKRGVVRGKIVKASYFREQGLGVFLKALRAQGWLQLFTNTQMGCSQPDVAEFYTNVSCSEGVLTSTVNGVIIQVDARALGVILGVPATGYATYVREDKKLESRERLLELAQRLSKQPGLRSPQSVKKGDMDSFHQLLFWFIIKNIIPRAQGRNQADAMDQCLIDLMDREIQINLPAFMIKHIMRIATTPRAHDLGYGFLLTKVFEHFGVELKNRVEAQVIDEIGSSTIMGCGFTLRRAGELVTDTSEEQEQEAPVQADLERSMPDPGQPAGSESSSSQLHLQDEIMALKSALKEEKELNAKRHADLLALLTALQPKPPAP